MNRKICFREKDQEGDIWAENAFIFEKNEDIEEFFKEDNPILLKLYYDLELEEELVGMKLEDFEVSRSTNNLITRVKFYTKESGLVFIYEMFGAYVIS